MARAPPVGSDTPDPIRTRGVSEFLSLGSKLRHDAAKLPFCSSSSSSTYLVYYFPTHSRVARHFSSHNHLPTIPPLAIRQSTTSCCIRLLLIKRFFCSCRRSSLCGLGISPFSCSFRIPLCFPSQAFVPRRIPRASSHHIGFAQDYYRVPALSRLPSHGLLIALFILCRSPSNRCAGFLTDTPQPFLRVASCIFDRHVQNHTHTHLYPPRVPGQIARLT